MLARIRRFHMIFIPALLVGCSMSSVSDRQLPPLHVGGWINGTGPTDVELQNKVVVLDFWAPW